MNRNLKAKCPLSRAQVSIIKLAAVAVLCLFTTPANSEPCQGSPWQLFLGSEDPVSVYNFNYISGTGSHYWNPGEVGTPGALYALELDPEEDIEISFDVGRSYFTATEPMTSYFVAEDVEFLFVVSGSGTDSSEQYESSMYFEAQIEHPVYPEPDSGTWYTEDFTYVIAIYCDYAETEQYEPDELEYTIENGFSAELGVEGFHTEWNDTGSYWEWQTNSQAIPSTSQWPYSRSALLDFFQSVIVTYTGEELNGEYYNNAPPTTGWFIEQKFNITLYGEIDGPSVGGAFLYSYLLNMDYNGPCEI